MKTEDKIALVLTFIFVLTCVFLAFDLIPVELLVKIAEKVE
jgi:hypothetical protein